MKNREIAARLAEAAAGMTDRDGTTTFRFGTLRVTCLATAAAVRAVAEKYRKGYRAGSNTHKLRKPSLKRPPDADAILAKLADYNCIIEDVAA